MRIKIDGPVSQRVGLALRLKSTLEEILRETMDHGIESLTDFAVKTERDGSRVIVTLEMDAANEETLAAVTDRVVKVAIHRLTANNPREYRNARLLGSGLVPA